MRLWNILTAGTAACLIAATPVLAQTTPNDTKPNAQPQAGSPSSGSADSSTGAKKQKTQGLPVGTQPPNYGSDWASKHNQPSTSQ